MSIHMAIDLGMRSACLHNWRPGDELLSLAGRGWERPDSYVCSALPSGLINQVFAAQA